MNAGLARSRCLLEIDLDTVISNYRSARQICGEGLRIIPVLKANAYGLGAAAGCRCGPGRQVGASACQAGYQPASPARKSLAISGKSEEDVLKGDLSPFKRAIARD